MGRHVDRCAATVEPSAHAAIRAMARPSVVVRACVEHQDDRGRCGGCRRRCEQLCVRSATAIEWKRPRTERPVASESFVHDAGVRGRPTVACTSEQPADRAVQRAGGSGCPSGSRRGPRCRVRRQPTPSSRSKVDPVAIVREEDGLPVDAPVHHVVPAVRIDRFAVVVAMSTTVRKGCHRSHVHDLVSDTMR